MSDIGSKPHEFPRVSLADFEVGVRETIHQRFDNLAAAWKFECGHDSFLTDLVIHPAYQQIIGMGEPAVPLLLEEMRTRPDHWDWALRAITGCDPVPKESWGKLREIAAAWVTWGKIEGLHQLTINFAELHCARMSPLRGFGRFLIVTAGSAALHPRLFKGDRYAVAISLPR